MSKKYIYLIAVVIFVAGVVGAVTRPSRGAARARGSSRSSSRKFTPRKSLPSNYGSLRSTQTRNAVRNQAQHRSRSVQTRKVVRPNAARIQPVADSGSRSTNRGGEVEWRAGQNGRAVVKGETARGRSYVGAQTVGGKRAAAVKTWRGDVVARDRNGNTGSYSKAGENWEQVNYVGVPYYYHDYHWYYPYYYSGEVHYREVYPPTDATVEELPQGAQVVEIEGREYILWDGVYYVNVDGTYKVVDRPTAGAAGPDALDLLDAMNQFLAGQQTLFVSTDELIAVPAGPGQFKRTRIGREIAMERPDKFRVRRREGSEPTKQFWYDGASATLEKSGQKFYGQIPFSGTLPDLYAMLQRDYAVTLPLSDLMQAGLVDSLQQRLTEAVYVAREKVDGRDCHHIRIGTADVEGELWIDALETAPYPRRVLLRYPDTPGKPTYEAKLSKWVVGRELAKHIFVYKPAEGLRRIDMLPVPR